MLGFSTVKVSGSSMSPTFMPGDWLVIKAIKNTAHPLKPLSVYLINDPERPGVKLLKRIISVEINEVELKEVELKEDKGEKAKFKYWLEGDHPSSTDSRKWGWLNQDQVVGKVVVRYRRGRTKTNNLKK
jgi:signal peptidase I